MLTNPLSLMTFALVSQFHIYLLRGQHLFSIVSFTSYNRFLNVKAVVAAFDLEKALVRTFSVIANLRVDFSFKL